MRFSIADTGIGISEKLQQRLFSPFEQGNAASTRKYGACGSAFHIILPFAVATVPTGTEAASGAELPTTPVSSSWPITVPCSTTFASVPVESVIAKAASDANAATGNDKKLAAARPKVASSAIQQKMIPSPRAKFRPNPPSR